MAATFQQLLIPIDFSEHASRALDYAIEWGRQLNAHLTLIHVIQSLSDVGLDMASALPAAHLETLEAELTQHMKDYLKRVENAGLEGDLVITHGTPFYEIIEVVKARLKDAGMDDNLLDLMSAVDVMNVARELKILSLEGDDE